MQKQICWLVCVLAALTLPGSELALEVRNNSHVRDNLVLSQPVNREWQQTAGTHALLERRADGTMAAVPWALDNSGGAPELVWLMPGVTGADTTRRFLWRPCDSPGEPDSDLKICADSKAIVISNSFFMLRHPLKGDGGFPSDITYPQSGQQDQELYFLDRLVSKDEAGTLRQFSAKDCEEATAQLLFVSPLRAVVEVRTGFGRKAAGTPGRPRAVYRYVYQAFTPVIDVSVTYSQEETIHWREVHFMHLSRRKPRYSKFITGDGGQTHAMLPAGARSTAITGRQWGVMQEESNACGVGFDGAVCWDAASEFVYYVRTGHATLEGREAQCHAGLYIGPSTTPAEYATWLGRDRLPAIDLYRDGQLWLPQEPLGAAETCKLENRSLRISFADGDKGFDCVGLENLLTQGPRFINAHGVGPGLWSLLFKAPPDAHGIQRSFTLDNHSGTTRPSVKQTRDSLIFSWHGLDLPDEPGVVDVRAEVALKRDATCAEWRIAVENRSRRLGLFSTSYPLLRGVVPPNSGDVLLPTGNWGGRLMRRHGGQFSATYPSARCPLQMAAFNLGETGLYIAAHDGAARTKTIRLERNQDFTVELLAEDAGTPGASGAPDYPVVTGVYRGDWWQAARFYRAWATRQAWCAPGPIARRRDYPQRLKELGFWMLLGGEAAIVEKDMNATAQLLPGIPVGVHWYTWHQIPFDHSYPEYFPTKEGMAQHARSMAAAGITVMPYINARLWDSEIESFAAAFTAAAKQASGTNYVEVYGSKRKLAPMCVTTPLWQAKVGEICTRLFQECGVNAIYLDQIGAARPAPCYDPSHGHPLGGGRHWVDGYRRMLTPIKRQAAQLGAVLTTENTAEPYMDTIDAFLVWNQREQEDVPLLPAIYSGYTTYFSSPQSATDTLDAFCAAQARDFLWGCQLGWNDSWMLQEKHRDKLDFTRELCRYRLALKDFMVEGQLLDEVRFSEPLRVEEHLWHRNSPHSARLPTVMGTLWRDNHGRLALVIVNTCAETQRCRFELNPAKWLANRGPWQSLQLTPDGKTPLALQADAALHLPDLRPREVRALIFTGK